MAKAKALEIKTGKLSAKEIEDNGFLQGLCYTLGFISRYYDQKEAVWTILNETNHTVEDFEKAGCDAYDLDEVKKALSECKEKKTIMSMMTASRKQQRKMVPSAKKVV